MPTPFFPPDQIDDARSVGTEQFDAFLSGRVERRVLNWMCRALPRWITPDQLTLIGFLGAALCLAGYIASNARPIFFLLADVGLILNWFGDSLDGSLARFRRIERPRYGYLVDHSFDSINYFCIFVGLGLSPYITFDVALFALCGILLLTQLSLMTIQLREPAGATFLSLGPTELRLIFIYLNTSMYIRGPLRWGFLSIAFSPYVVGVAAMGVIFTGLFAVNVFSLAGKLARQE